MCIFIFLTQKVHLECAVYADNNPDIKVHVTRLKNTCTEPVSKLRLIIDDSQSSGLIVKRMT